MYFDFNFISHFTEEIILLKELENEFDNLKFMNRKRSLKNVISICKKENTETDDNYTIIDDNLHKIIINKDEFWENWNKYLEKIIEGD